MSATVTHKDSEPQHATRWVDNGGALWFWDGWEWACTVNGAPFCHKSWENIPRRMFPMTRAT